MNKIEKIIILDLTDKHPISYSVSNQTEDGFDLVEIACRTFKKSVAFNYSMIDQVIEALQEIKKGTTK